MPRTAPAPLVMLRTKFQNENDLRAVLGSVAREKCRRVLCQHGSVDLGVASGAPVILPDCSSPAGWEEHAREHPFLQGVAATTVGQHLRVSMQERRARTQNECHMCLRLKVTRTSHDLVQTPLLDVSDNAVCGCEAVCVAPRTAEMSKLVLLCG